VITTWREVIDAAMTVGRDAFAWLAAVPSLASAEIIARRSPLAAYLYPVSNQSLPFRTAGYHLEPNVVCQEGTEKTARALFAYRTGMTMAEWAYRKLMGLGPTIHAEAVPELQGRGPAWSQQNGQPDLVGYHWQSTETWLIEAKAARRLGKHELPKGASQLCATGLMVGPHMRVLCGTSIEHRIFVTVDVEMAAGDGEKPGEPSQLWDRLGRLMRGTTAEMPVVHQERRGQTQQHLHRKERNLPALTHGTFQQHPELSLRIARRQIYVILKGGHAPKVPQG
jgi:hypothetical protein